MENGVEKLLESVDIDRLRSALITWYETDHRSFPWRETDDPYEILVSEVMSQQTQLDRVEPAWEAFLDNWPTPAALAAASRADVVSFWSDHRLGYNNRARYLHESAIRIETAYDGAIPATTDELQTLPGVGPYTANAIASFAFDAGDAVVDTNVKRVCYRVFADLHDEDSPPYQALANALMPKGSSCVWNNAMMELGAVACRKTPQCDEADCPWRFACDAYASGDFRAPDVPTQPPFDGSRRQFRGRVVRTLGEYEELPLDDLGPRIRVDYSPDGEFGREWLVGLLEDLADDGLIELAERDDVILVRLRE